MSEFSLSGTPVRLDLFLRPAVRTIQLIVGVIPSFVLAWFGYLWIAPLPLAASFVGYDRFFAARRDIPMTLTFADTLTIKDSTTNSTITVDPAEVDAITVHHRERGVEQREVVVVLSSADDVLLSVRFFVNDDVPLPSRSVDVEWMDALLGGYGGLVAPTAEPSSRCRQTIRDLEGRALAWFQDKLSAEAWNRTRLRVWRGQAPPLDNFGLHTEAHTGMLTLEGDRWHFSSAEKSLEGHLGEVSVARTTRSVELARKPEEGETIEPGSILVEEVKLPVLVLRLGPDLHVAIPAPLAAAAAEEIEAEDTLLHCHVPEGGALIWSYFRAIPKERWPAALQEQAEYVSGSAQPWVTPDPTPSSLG